MQLPENTTAPIVYTVSTSGLPVELSSGSGMNLLWLPYVILTLILLGLLVASFAHFHYKYRDRYIKRSQLARNIPEFDIDASWGHELDVSYHNGPCPPEECQSIASGVSKLSGVPNSNGTGGGPGTPKKGVGRLTMLYGNKVDVEQVIGHSMFDKGNKDLATIDRSDSVTSLNGDAPDDDYINENDAYRMSSRASSGVSLSGPDGSKKKTTTSVNIWATAASKSHGNKQPAPKHT